MGFTKTGFNFIINVNMSENLTEQFLKQAFQLQADKHYKQAVEALYKALCIEPDNVEILSQISHLYYLMNNFERSLEYAEKILEINPVHVDTLRTVININKFAKKYAKALEVAEKLYNSSPDKENFIILLELLSECGQHEKLLEAIENSPFVKDNDEKILFLKGYTYLKLSNTQEAVNIFNHIISCFPSNIDAKYYLAVIYYEQQKYDEAENLFRSILDDIQSDKIYNYLGLINLEKHKTADAINYFQFAIKIDSQNAGYYFNLGTAYSLNGWLDEAEECFRKALSFEPENIVYSYSLAYLAYQKKEYKKALEAVEKTLEIVPGYPDAIILKSLIDAENNNVIAAKNELTALEQKEKNNDFLYYALAKIYKKFPLYKDAIDALQKALFIKPESLEYMSELADCYCEMEDYPVAKDIIAKVLYLNPHFIYAHLLNAKINIQQKHYSKALQIVENAIKLDNSSAEAYKYRALIYQKQGLKNRAIESAKTAVTLQPANTEYYEFLAKLYLEVQEYENAFLYFKEAALIDGTKIEYIYNAAVAADKNKDFVNASAYYSYALRLDPYNNLIIYEYVDLLVRNKKIKQALSLLKSKISSVESKNIEKLLKQKYKEISEQYDSSPLQKIRNFFIR